MAILARNILLTVGVLAILIGALVAGILVLRPKGPAGGPQAAAGPTVAVLVAARPVPAGGLLREEDLTWRPMVVKALPAGSLTQDKVSQAQYVGAVARRPILAGQIVLDSAVIGPNDRRFLAAVLSPGTRGVTMAVNEAQSAAGLILPDDRVDVILVGEPGGANAPGQNPVSAQARILIHDVRVVAVDRAMDRPAPAANAPALPRTITMELGDIDAQRLFLAQQAGAVSLTVRALARTSLELAQSDRPVTGADLFGPSAFARGEIGPRSPPVLVGQTPDILNRPPTYRAARSPSGSPITIVRGSRAATP